jgi:hypothetical protein
MEKVEDAMDIFKIMSNGRNVDSWEQHDVMNLTTED